MKENKAKRLNVRMSEQRLNRLRGYAEYRDKSITSLLEDWIDSLPQAKVNEYAYTEKSLSVQEKSET